MKVSLLHIVLGIAFDSLFFICKKLYNASKDASLKWSIEDIHELENWGMRLNILNTMPMFEEYKNNFTPEKRTGMNISDNMKIMSLAYIELSNA